MGERLALDAATWQAAVDAAARVLRAGGVALLPAEGVYGLHAVASDARAVGVLRTLKPRDAEKPYIALLARPADVGEWAASIGARARTLLDAHWPGALTLIFEAAPAVPTAVRGADGTVAVRCPGSAFLRAVVEAVGSPIASTSANAPGDPPAARVPESLAPRVDLVVDQGPLSGEASTVISVVNDEIRIVRAGAVPISRTA